MEYAAERRVAIEAVLKACKLCQSVFKKLVTTDTVSKKDNSPVTVADYGAQAVVVSDIRAAFPNDKVVGEEDASDLRKPEEAVLKKHVIELTQSISPNLTETDILNAIDYGTYEGGNVGRHWALDPIDGTKGFLRGEQYAIALALIRDGKVVLGVLGCPNLPHKNGTGCVFVGVKGQGSYMRAVSSVTETRIAVDASSVITAATITESVEAAHSDHSESAKMMERLGIKKPAIRMDSQCKYAIVARGDASIYLRLPTLKNYQEKIWDHAAGYSVITEAGGKVTDIEGKELDFGVGRTLKNNKGVVATNGLLHGIVLTNLAKI